MPLIMTAHWLLVQPCPELPRVSYSPKSPRSRTKPAGSKPLTQMASKARLDTLMTHLRKHTIMRLLSNTCLLSQTFPSSQCWLPKVKVTTTLTLLAILSTSSSRSRHPGTTKQRSIDLLTRDQRRAQPLWATRSSLSGAHYCKSKTCSLGSNPQSNRGTEECHRRKISWKPVQAWIRVRANSTWV